MTYRTLRFLHLLVLLALVASLAACGRVEEARQPLPQADTTLTSVAQTADTPTVAAVQTAQPTEPAALTVTAAAPFDVASVPACVFDPNAPAAEPAAKSLGALTFSEPQVVFTGKNINIEQWLPDNKHVLLSMKQPNSSTLSLATLDVNTQNVNIFADNLLSQPIPVWLESAQEVVFADDNGTNTMRNLQGSKGIGSSFAQITTGVANPYIAASPDGRFLYYFQEKKSTTISQDSSVLTIFDAITGVSTSTRYIFPENMYRIAASSDGRLILFDETTLLLYDSHNDDLCMMDINQHLVSSTSLKESHYWPIQVQWSPDNRFIAMASTTYPDLPAPDSELLIFDTLRGDIYPISVPSHFVFEADWNANSRQVVIQALKESDAYSKNILIAVDVIGKSHKIIAPDQRFSSGYSLYIGGGTAWSPDGSTIAVRCPLWEDNAKSRVCIIKVN